MTNNRIISHDSETPAHGQQVICADAFIHHSFNGIEKVFLPKRAIAKKFLPGVYELPGGHIDFGEDPISGLKREIKEELSMEISVGDPFYVFTYHNTIKGSQSLEVIYFATFINPINEIKLNPADHSEYLWLNEEEISLTTLNRPEEERNHPIFKAIFKGFSLLKGNHLNFGE